MMVDNEVQGRLVMVYVRLLHRTTHHSFMLFHSGSVVGFFGLAGYSQYSPTKFALRGECIFDFLLSHGCADRCALAGFAESISQELQVYGIKVHLMFPATILSPGMWLN